MGDDMEERIEGGIGQGKVNKAVEVDGVHVEMYQAEPKLCAKLIRTW